MNNFILAITTYNRLSYLKGLIDSWKKTKSENINWHIVIADDGSNDGTIKYIESLRIADTQLTLIKNNRLGVHQQMNTIIKKLETIDFDFCFKVDDDIEFLKPGWDNLYYKTVINTGYEHLVFCEDKWSQEQFLNNEIFKGDLVSKINILNVQGCFYTLTPNIINKVGYFDAKQFGFRGMGHVDYTARCCRAGYNDINNPFDVKNSNEYISAKKNNYQSSINKEFINRYDSFKRKEKEIIILNNNRIYIPLVDIDSDIYIKFEKELLNISFLEIEKQQNIINKQKQTIEWFENENKKIKSYYNKKYEFLPKWYKVIGSLLEKKQT